MSYLVCFRDDINHIVNATFVSLLAWPDPDRDCDLRRVSTTIEDRDRLGLGYELYITPVVGVGDADFHRHRIAGVFAMGRAWQDLAQLSRIVLSGFCFLQLTKRPNKFV